MTEYIDLLIGDLERIIKANGSVMGGTKFPADKVNDIIKKYQNKEISGDKEVDDRFVLGEGGFVQGFEDNLVGMKAGEEKEFTPGSP